MYSIAKLSFGVPLNFRRTKVLIDTVEPLFAGTVYPPTEAGAPWVAEAGGKYFRLGASMAAAAQAMNGDRTVEALVEHLGAPWTTADMQKVVLQFEVQRLLGVGRPERRVRYVRPLTIQFGLLDASRLQLLGKLSRSTSGAAASVIVLVPIWVALLATVFRWQYLWGATAEPITTAQLGTIGLLLTATTVIHELAHAGLLLRYGGRPRRMGIMFFYGLPAFFCDISNAWLLPRSRQRVNVALAGIVAQLWAASLLVVAAALPFLPKGTSQVFAIAGTGAAASALFNLVPFVKLDGYIALMSWLDWPGLRPSAIRFAQDCMDGVFQRPKRGRSGIVFLFGISCMVFPAILLFRAAVYWSDTFSMVPGAGVFAPRILLVSFLGFVSVVIIRQFLRGVRGSERPVLARFLSCAIAVGLGLLLTVPISSSPQTLRFVVINGELNFAVPKSVSAERLTGPNIELRRQGLIRSSKAGQAVGDRVLIRQEQIGWSASSPIALPKMMHRREWVATGFRFQLDPGVTGGIGHLTAPRRSLLTIVREKFAR